MSHEFNRATLAWAMTASRKHTQTHSSPWCLRKPHACFLLCPPIFHDHFARLLLPFISLHSISSSSLFSPPLETFSSPVFLSHCALLTPHYSLIWPVFPLCQPFHTVVTLWPSFRSLHVNIHPSVAVGSWLLAAVIFWYFLLVSFSPVGFLTFILHLSFYSIPWCLFFDPLSL